MNGEAETLRMLGEIRADLAVCHAEMRARLDRIEARICRIEQSVSRIKA